jgi:hypothetical protein
MAILTVKQDGSGTHTEIQAAIFDASTGDTIEIGPGTFEQTVDLYKGVTLTGAGQGVTIIRGAITTNFVKTPGYTCTAGSTTLNFASGTEGLLKGRLITGTGIPANTRIASVSPNSVTISQATTAARTVATNATMTAMNDATIRIRGSGPRVENMTVEGFDGVSPAVEYAAIYVRNAGNGAPAASNYVINNAHVIAVGEYAILTDATPNIVNGEVSGCKISGKTFSGANPATGNQFSVPNVPRQLCVFQAQNTGTMVFSNNEIIGETGGLTVDGIPSFNVGVTVDVPGAVVTSNSFNGKFGTSYALRVRTTAPTIENNTNVSRPPNENLGYFFIIDGTTLAGLNVGSNTSLTSSLVEIEQTGQTLSVSMDKDLVSGLAAVQASPTFSNESNWKLVGYIFKHDSSAKRVACGFQDFETGKSVALKATMQSGETYQLHKLIVSTPSRELLVIPRADIDGASEYDFTLS